MSIRSEIRAALVDGPKSVDELMLILPSRETTDRARLSNNMSVLANEAKVRRCGLSDDGKPLYQLEPSMWPAKEAAGDPADQTAAEATTEAAPPAKRGRKAKAEASGTIRKGRKPATARKAAKGTKPAPARTPSPARAQRPDAKAARKPARGEAAGKRARQPAAALDLSHPTQANPTAGIMASLGIDATRTRGELIAAACEAAMFADWLAGRSSAKPRDLVDAAMICGMRAATLRALALLAVDTSR